MTKLEIGLACAVVLLVLLGIGDLVARRQGAQACVTGDTQQSAKADVSNAHAEATQTVADATEDRNRDNALAAPIAATPTFGVQPPPVAPGACPVSKARAAPGPSQPGPDVRAASPPGVVRRDWNSFVRADVQRAHDADVEIADRDKLLTTLQTLCTPKEKPP